MFLNGAAAPRAKFSRRAGAKPGIDRFALEFKPPDDPIVFFAVIYHLTYRINGYRRIRGLTIRGE